MKGILSLNEKNQYILFDKEKTTSYNLSELIDTYRNDKIKVYTKSRYDLTLGTFILYGTFNGYISSKKIGKGLYDNYITDKETSLKIENNRVIDYDNLNGFNLTDWLFKNVGELICIDIKIDRQVKTTKDESEDAK